MDQVEPMFKYLKQSFQGIQLVCVVLPGKTPVYGKWEGYGSRKISIRSRLSYPLAAEVKRVGDTVLGVATQCVQAKNVIKTTPQTLSNLCLKVNLCFKYLLAKQYSFLCKFVLEIAKFLKIFS